MDPEIGRQRATDGSPPRPDLWPALAGLACPTLVVWGMESDVLSAGQARRMVETLPRGEWAAVPGVGHAPTLMEPAALAALDAFLTPLGRQVGSADYPGPTGKTFRAPVAGPMGTRGERTGYLAPAAPGMSGCLAIDDLRRLTYWHTIRAVTVLVVT